MNTRTRKNGTIVRERVVNWKDTKGKTNLHYVKDIPSGKRRKLNHPSNLSNSTVPLNIGSEEIGHVYDSLEGSETMLGTRQNQVSDLSI
jgi:hypothetical protein